MQFVAIRENRVRSVIDIVVDSQVLARPNVMMTYDVANKLGGSSLLPVDWMRRERHGLMSLSRTKS
jgi:hypothetical protein